MKCFVKKFISIVLILGIALGVSVIDDFDWINIKSYAEGITSGGKCGDDTYFTFDGRKLFVGGKGRMYDYFFIDPEQYDVSDEENYPPWFLWRDEIQEVEIGNKIESVGSYSFSHCDFLETVSIPYESVKSIERNAFDSCEKLKTVNLSNGLNEIGAWAFMGCISLKSIDIPDSVHIIDRAAFYGSGIEHFIIPENVEEINREAFAECEKLISVSLPQNLSTVSRGVFFGCKNLKSIAIPNTVNEIGRSAFDNCTGLTEINIPDSVYSIGMDAFNGCSNLNKIKMSKNIMYIDECAFNDTGYYNNESNWENGVLYIDEFLIASKIITKNYHIKDGTRSVARHAFENCVDLTSVIVPASVKSFAYNSFYECNNLKSIVFLGRKIEFNDVLASNETEMTFYCYSDSTAYSFAQKKGIKCVLLDELKTGDATGDKVINSSDALKVLQFSVGQSTDVNESYPAMDVNMDGSVNSSDALAILQKTVGIIDSFECCSINSTDKDNFTRFMAFILGYGREYTSIEPLQGNAKDYFECNYKNYDCTSSDAFETAFGYMLGAPYNSCFNYLASMYDWNIENYSEVYFRETDKPFISDPLKKFNQNSGYSKIVGKQYDLLLKEVFNVQPNHDFILSDENSRWFGNKESAYYYDGYYYILGKEGGDAAGPKTVINYIELNSDRKYHINITYQWGNDFEGYADIAEIHVVASLKNVNGNRIWSIYKIEKTV